HEDVARDDMLAAVALHAEALGMRVAAVLGGAASFLLCHWSSPLRVAAAQAPTMEVMRTVVRSWRWPRLRREFLRRRFLKAMTLGPRVCSTSSATTLAPEMNGLPTCGLSPPIMSTSA